jgi:hypothetical protein
MDHYGPLPLTLEALRARLKRGETFTITGSEGGFSCALYLDKKGRIILQQGNQEQPFHHLEVAVMTRLDCLGELSQRERLDEQSI